MPNQYFNFKQFTVNQDKTAMKVGTDGVLLGAWTNTENAKTILDIGTGTGLIALMLAQKSNANIVAVEKNVNAYNQAVENINKSKWKNRIEVINSSFQDFSENYNLKFDLVVSNPPFFTNSLKNSCINKTEARHNDSLPYNDLVKGVNKLSHSETAFHIILPFDQKDDFIDLCRVNQFYCNKITFVKPNPEKNIKRILMTFSKNDLDCIQETIVIENKQRHDFTDEYKKLTGDYYLLF
jgi:tRNA1Val (adenine37-N6)-methyltransferase